jgi:hypothetical protein
VAFSFEAALRQSELAKTAFAPPLRLTLRPVVERMVQRSRHVAHGEHDHAREGERGHRLVVSLDVLDGSGAHCTADVGHQARVIQRGLPVLLVLRSLGATLVPGEKGEA